MRHYEIMLLVHPDQSEQVPAMLDRYIKMIKDTGGQIHRKEDLGRRGLAYPMKKVHKAHFLLLNIECGLEILTELQSNFRFNDAVLRFMIEVKKAAETEPSILSLKQERQESHHAMGEERHRG